MKKILSLFVALIATSALWASDVITYTATAQLPEVSYWESNGLHTNAFNVAIVDHTFSSGTGTITFSGEVTSIGRDAFCGCSGLTSITIPSSVTNIGDYAFSGCSGLTSITIPSSVTSIGDYAFRDCSGLTSITIPNSVTSIGDAAFYGCTSLKTVVWNARNCQSPTNSSDPPFYSIRNYIESFVFGDEVETIPSYLCFGMNKLISVTIPNSVTSIGEWAFYGCFGLTSITISNSVTSIGYSAFYGCSGLTSIIIPNSVTSIGYSAFSGCFDLTSITIPSSVTSIGNYAFYNCSSLTSITIPNSVTSIGTSAFYGCSGLTSVTIGNSVTSIGSWAFSGCSGLTSIVVESGNTMYDSRDNCNAIIETASNTLIAGCKNTIIPSSVTSIGNYAFYDCSGLTSITIPNSVTSIGGYAFEGCSGLTSIVVESSNTQYDSRGNCNAIIETASNTLVAGCKNTTIPNSVTSIGGYAFYECSGLTSITIPNSVTSIGSRAFSGCNNLKLVINSSSLNITRGSSDYGSVAQYADKVFTGTIVGEFVILNDTILSGYLGNGGGVVIPGAITNVDERAFYGCLGLTSIMIPNSMTSIGDSAFYGCDSLKTVYNASSLDIVKGAETHGYVAYYAINVEQNIRMLPYSEKFSNNQGDFIIKDVSLDGMSFVWKFDSKYGMKASAYVNNVKHTAESWLISPCLKLPADSAISLTFDHVYRYTNTPATDLTLLVSENYFDDAPSTATWTAVTIPVFSSGSNWTFVSAGYIDLSAYAGKNIHIAFRYSSSSSEAATWEIKNVKVFAAESHYTLFSSAEHATIMGAGTYNFLTPVELTAIPDYGYHFLRWSDGVINNPRTIVLTQDTTIMAEFAINQYTVTSSVEHGTIDGMGTYDYLTPVALTVNPDYGYHFVRWSDGVTDNPRSFVLTQDTLLVAEIANNQYTISMSAENGSVTGAGAYDYLTSVNLTASADYGYHFIQWSDGNTDNPRSFVLMQDTAFAAEFERNSYSVTIASSDLTKGTVTGSTSALYQEDVTITATPATGYQFNGWSDSNTDNPRTITVTQDTSLVANFDTKMCTLAILSNIDEAADLLGAGTYAYGTAVTCSVDVMTDYRFVKWGNGKTANPYKFKIYDDMTLYAFFEEGGAPLAPDSVVVTPEENNANLQWPQVDNAQTYTMTITKDGEIICTLTFNGLGQLVNIDFSAPARATTSAKVASATTGFNFTITGLESGTTYGYTIVARDEKDNVLSVEEGTFSTTGQTTSLDTFSIGVDKPFKFLRDGKILIQRGNTTYNLRGQKIK